MKSQQKLEKYKQMLEELIALNDESGASVCRAWIPSYTRKIAQAK